MFMHAGSSAVNAIRMAMEAYETETCISFVERTNEADYVSFFAGQG